ncbi:NAD-dependent epimerase/dehydratase family protein [Sanguibacter sp. A247]|uniref:NAD-dependent epimerase/dehydratase family protein n=1 Tax=unclassified Sanguibacter TaxID=2645534 RepID=UPI003FD80424
MGRTIIIGTGLLAAALVRAIEAQGHDAVTVGRRDGVDITRPVDLRPFVGDDGIDAVIEATNTSARSSADSIAFFEASTRNTAAAAQAIGAGMHVVVSIVGCERAPGASHYDGKAAQERAARAAATPQTPVYIVQSTQWFALARQLVDLLARGPVMPVPSMRIRPVALDAVADVVAELVLGRRERADACLCGPEETTLAALVGALVDRPPIRIPVPFPGAARAVRRGALLPTGGTEAVGPTFAEWLSAHPDGRRPDLRPACGETAASMSERAARLGGVSHRTEEHPDALAPAHPMPARRTPPTTPEGTDDRAQAHPGHRRARRGHS